MKVDSMNRFLILYISFCTALLPFCAGYSQHIISKDDNEGMAELMLRQGKNKEALAYMNKAIAKDPSNAGLYSNRSTCYLRLGNAKKALGDIEKAFVLMKGKNLKPSTQGMFYFNRGSIFRALKRDKEAFRDLKQSSEMWPLNPGVHLALAEMLQQMGKTKQAIESYNDARQLYNDFGGPKGKIRVGQIDVEIKKLGGVVEDRKQPEQEKKSID